MKKYDYKKLPPFKGMVLQNFPFIEEDFDAITNYQLLCKVVEYLNVIAKNNDEMIDNIKTLNTWFDNLDVQEEINNKLDEMASDGTLQEIIADYLDTKALFTFDTENDLINATNLINGSYAKTLGKNTLNDGFGATYKITESAISGLNYITLSNGLIANVINNFENNYINEISYKTGRYANSDYYVISIPYKDSNNNTIVPYVNYSNTLTPNQYAREDITTATCNATLGIGITPNTYVTGSVISNHEILRDYTFYDIPNGYKYLCIDNDRNIVSEPINNTTASYLTKYQCAFTVFYELLVSGNKVNQNTINLTEHDESVFNANPRMMVGIKLDKTMIIVAVDGRIKDNKGLTFEEQQDLMLELGCVDAWNLDGGGSTSLSYKGNRLNRLLDNNGTSERKIGYTLNFKKETINKQLGYVNSFIGETKNQLRKEFIENSKYGTVVNLSGTSLNDDIKNVITGMGNMLDNTSTPISTNTTDNNGYLRNVPHFASELSDKYNSQLFSFREINRLYSRLQINGNFTQWRALTGNDIIDIRITPNQTIVNDNTYEILTLADYETNPYLNTNLFTLDTTNKQLTISERGAYKIETTVQITPTTSGNKYIKIKLGNRDYVISSYGTAGQNLIITLNKTYYISQSDINNNNNNLSVEIYGKTGDGLVRGNIIVTAC